MTRSNASCQSTAPERSVERVRLDALQPLGWRDSVVAVGNFDGVHLGHQALLAAAVTRARASGSLSVALTFDPHPSQVVAPRQTPGCLMTLEQRAALIQETGLDRLAVLPFTPGIAAWAPEEFVQRVLVTALDAGGVIVGQGFRFGHRRAGGVDELRRLGQAAGFEVVAHEPVLQGGLPISSTRIREAVAGGQVAQAAALLGRPFFVEGVVVRGAGRGRTLAVPTANIEPTNEFLPERGVYAARCGLEQQNDLEWPAVVNVGRRPTFDGGGVLLVEAHLLEFQGDLYGRLLRVGFLTRLRSERRFSGPDALKKQILEDVAQARRILILEPDGRKRYSQKERV